MCVVAVVESSSLLVADAGLSPIRARKWGNPLFGFEELKLEVLDSLANALENSI